jgi:amino acid adenylation domain-containing protein
VLDLGPELVARLRAVGRAHGATTAALVLAALEVVLHRWTGQDDLVLGAVASLRDRADLARTVGCLVGSAHLRVRLAPDLPFGEVLARARGALLDAAEAALAPAHAVAADVAGGTGDGGPMFHVLFNALPPRLALAPWGALEVELEDDEAPRTPVDLTLYVQERGSTVRLELVHDAWLLDGARALELGRQVEAVLAQAALEPARAIAAFELLTPEAAAALPDPGAPLARARGETLHGAFAAVAARAPDRVALVDERGAWTYGRLARRAAAVARALAAQGVAPGDRVAVWAHRSAPLAAALLGVLRAGAAFSVLDPEHPPARLAKQVERLAPAALLLVPLAGPVPADLDEALGSAPRLVIDDEVPAEVDVAVEVEDAPAHDDPRAVAYVAFTSGTTGTPKAVEGEHGPVTHFLAWQRATFGLGADDRVSVLSGLGHDPLLRDLFAPLLAGGSAHLPAPELRRDPTGLVAWLRAEQVTCVHATPALLSVLTAAPAAPLPDLRLVFTGGDRLTGGDARRLRAVAPAARLVGLYGTTETPQGVGAHEVAADLAPAATAPVGRGIDAVQLLVLGPGDRLAAPGERGELCVRTPHLTRGYLGDDALTRARFAPAPRPCAPWDRMYRTGDLARYAPDGAVELAGRGDRQVKVRGHRVELGEVEAALGRVPGVERAVAALRDGPAGPRLLAWASPRAGARLDPAALRLALAAALPEPAVPAAVGLVDAWPLTPNGKLDLARLVAPAPAEGASTRAGREPRTQTEEVIAALWAELLGRERVWLEDDFFALGGHSLLAVRMLGLLGERLGTLVPLAALLRAPTVAGLARELHARGVCEEEALVLDVRPTGALAPLWVLHPVGGHVVFARRLAAGIDPARPVLGIQAEGLDGRRPPLATVEAMAARYLELVRQRQPRGPYHLVGPSFGGLVAWEMARRLAAEGEQVGLLALLDTFAPGYPRRHRLPRRIVEHLLEAARRPTWPERRAYLAEHLVRLRRRRPGAPVKLQARYAERVREQLGDAALADVVRRVVAVNLEASMRYTPGPYPGRLLLLRASRRQRLPGWGFDDPTNGWSRLAGEVAVRPVDATHQRMVDLPAVDEVARLLDEALRAGDGRAESEERRAAA